MPDSAPRAQRRPRPTSPYAREQQKDALPSKERPPDGHPRRLTEFQHVLLRCLRAATSGPRSAPRRHFDAPFFVTPLRQKPYIKHLVEISDPINLSINIHKKYKSNPKYKKVIQIERYCHEQKSTEI